MKVMLVCPYSLSHPGGVQGQVLALAKALASSNIQVRIVAPTDGPPPEPGIISAGPSTQWPTNGSIAPISAGPEVSKRVMNALESFQPDVVHLHEPFVPGATVAALLNADCPIVATFHASGKMRAFKYLKHGIKGAADRINVLTAVSPDAKLDAEMLVPGDYHIVPNGVDTSRFGRVSPWATDRTVIMFVGRHEERKGLSVLLDAFSDIDRDVELWVASVGPQTEKLKARGLRRVRWLGSISNEELARRLKAARVFCAPSLGSESFGVVLLEAMAAGAAIVASNIDGYRQVARDGQEALLVPPGDAGALRAALQKVLDDPALADGLIEAGKKRADELSMANLAAKYQDIYRLATQSPRLVV